MKLPVQHFERERERERDRPVYNNLIAFAGSSVSIIRVNSNNAVITTHKD